MPPDVPSHSNKLETPKHSDKLSHESNDSLLHPRYKKHNWAALDLEMSVGADGAKSGSFKVTAGNEGYSLSLIASRALAMRGKNPEDGATLQAEMDRIVALNKDKYKSLEKHRNFLQVGWSLKIWDESMGPDATQEWKPGKEAVAGSQVACHKGDRIIARAGSSVVVEPGGEARLDPGAKAFLVKDGRISAALTGSRILAVGGEIHDFGATIIAPNPGDLKVVHEDPAKLAAMVQAQKPEVEVAKGDTAPPKRGQPAEYAFNNFDNPRQVSGLPVVEIF